MVSHIDKKSYLDRRTEQLRQWEPILGKLILRAEKAPNKSETELHHHIIKIQVKKARIEAKLKALRKAGKGEWDDLKIGFENSWKDLRQAFLKSSADHNKD